MARLTCVIFVGANCNVEFQAEGGERRFLAAFSDIDDICYETELMSRGRVLMDVRTSTMVGGGGGKLLVIISFPSACGHPNSDSHHCCSSCYSD